jgi:TolA-binding protein
LAEAAKRAEKRDAEHRRTVEALQEQQGDARQQIGVLQGKLAALEDAYISLQEQLKSPRATTRPSARRAPTAESRPPARRAARKAAVGKTARAKDRA